MITKKEILNLIDALNEWNEIVGAKELDDSEIGLDSKRYNELMEKLKRHLDNMHQSEESEAWYQQCIRD